MLTSNSLENFKQIEQKIPEILHFHFFIVLQDASVTSYLIENDANNLQKVDIHLAQIAEFRMSQESFGALRSMMAPYILHFHPLSFELNFCFDRIFPLKFIKCNFQIVV